MHGLKILHAGNGELSLEVERIKNNSDLAGQVEARFGAVGGISRVKADPEKGTVEVTYDKEELTSLMNLWSLNEAFAALFPEVNAMELAALLGDRL